MTDQEHARAIAEQAAKLHRSIDPGWCHWPTTCNACELIAAALSLTADTARAQGRQELDEAVALLKLWAYPEKNLPWEETKAWLRARATPGDTLEARAAEATGENDSPSAASNRVAPNGRDSGQLGDPHGE